MSVILLFLLFILLKTYHTLNLCIDLILSHISTRFILIMQILSSIWKTSMEYFSEAVKYTRKNTPGTQYNIYIYKMQC